MFVQNWLSARMRTVRGKEVWHAGDGVSFSSIASSLIVLTLFMSPSEDRTSQTIMIHQLISIVSQASACSLNTCGGCRDVISMRYVEQAHRGLLGNHIVCILHAVMGVLRCEGIRRVVSGVYIERLGVIDWGCNLHLAHSQYHGFNRM
jgi:hypothetical protein